jgi:hypothetical protein
MRGDGARCWGPTVKPMAGARIPHLGRRALAAQGVPIYLDPAKSVYVVHLADPGVLLAYRLGAARAAASLARVVDIPLDGRADVVVLHPKLVYRLAKDEVVDEDGPRWATRASRGGP